MDTLFEKVWDELNAIYAERLAQRPFFPSNLKLESDKFSGLFSFDSA